MKSSLVSALLLLLNAVVPTTDIDGAKKNGQVRVREQLGVRDAVRTVLQQCDASRVDSQLTLVRPFSCLLLSPGAPRSHCQHSKSRF